MSYYIAVDIGGTQIRAGIFKGNNHLPVDIKRTSTKGENSPLDKVIQIIDKLLPDSGKVNAIGVASPGPVDPYRGIVISAPNIPGWSDVHLKDELESQFKVPVIVGNDANYAAMGEWKYGSGRGHHDLIYLTISTGIGGGIIINDSLLLGHHGLAGEMGHITLLPDGPLCGCGQKGHLEALSSGTAITGWVAEKIRDGHQTALAEAATLTAKDVYIAAKQGDALAIEAFNQAGYYLGMGIANFLHIFNPTAVILGGGVSQSGDLLIQPVLLSLNNLLIDQAYREDFILTRASLGDEAGLIGALSMVQGEFP